MIIEFLVSPLFNLANFLINSLPLLVLPVSLVDGLSSLLECWNTISAFVPVNFVIILVGAYWTLVNGKLFIAIVSWIYEKIPFV